MPLALSNTGYQKLLIIKSRVENICASIDEHGSNPRPDQIRDDLQNLADEFYSLLELLVKEDH